MEQRKVGFGARARGGLTQRGAYARSVWRVRRSLLGLGLVGMLLPAAPLVAQDGGRLTVRPRAMATGTQNPAAGEYPLDSVPDVLVSVPPQCVGPRRCPLVIFLPSGYGARQVTDWLRPVTDKYGLILLAPPTLYSLPGRGVPLLDAAMKEVLQRFAIDPAKIALVGRCGSGQTFGIENLDVFSRIAVVSSFDWGVGWADKIGPPKPGRPVEFFFEGGIGEAGATFAALRELRAAGYPVKQMLGLRGHEHQVEGYDYLGRWLQESWAQPDPARRRRPQVVADPLPVLTPEVLRQMTTFWTLFQQEPYEVRMTARRAHLREAVVPVGAEQSSVPLVEMAALAAQYPAVAAKLAAAGLTAPQHDAYRVALISALVIQRSRSSKGSSPYRVVAESVDPASVEAQNADFLDAHADEVAALAEAGIEHPERVKTATIAHPEGVKAMGPLGIWRTP